MQQSLKIPIVIPRVKIEGPKTFREIDMILDTGAVYTMISWDIAVNNIEVICHNIPEVVGIEGLLGLSFLKEFRTLIDYRKKILEII